MLMRTLQFIRKVFGRGVAAELQRSQDAQRHFGYMLRAGPAWYFPGNGLRGGLRRPHARPTGARRLTDSVPRLLT
jgi:hypothetical protein